VKIPIIIDGKMAEVDTGASIFEAAQKVGVHIPTLCHHGSLKPYGSCRLCMVEVVQNKQRRWVTSCGHPVESGMEVFTDTAKLRKMRSMAMELLLARCSDVPMVQAMARKMGVDATRFKKNEENGCVLCGLCVRFCEEIVGVGAICLANRGVDREVATPFKVASDICIGCGSCTYICPTGCIEMVAGEKTPQLREMKMDGHTCPVCSHDYQCETCPSEQEFLVEMRRVVSEFRDLAE
jgi:NADH dehydrogenase/NADH:ubiquinone oxidoreductase subunit G